MKKHSEHFSNWRVCKKRLAALTALKLGLQTKIPNQNPNETGDETKNVMSQG